VRFRKYFSGPAAESPSNLDYIPRGKGGSIALALPNQEMEFGKKWNSAKKSWNFLATSRRVKRRRTRVALAAKWRGIASGVRAVVAAREDHVALALYRSDGVVIGIAGGELVVSFAQL
jgi:hypothetical protein